MLDKEELFYVDKKFSLKEANRIAFNYLKERITYDGMERLPKYKNWECGTNLQRRHIHYWIYFQAIIFNKGEINV